MDIICDFAFHVDAKEMKRLRLINSELIGLLLFISQINVITNDF